MDLGLDLELQVLVLLGQAKVVKGEVDVNVVVLRFHSHHQFVVLSNHLLDLEAVCRHDRAVSSAVGCKVV